MLKCGFPDGVGIHEVEANEGKSACVNFGAHAFKGMTRVGGGLDAMEDACGVEVLKAGHGGKLAAGKRGGGCPELKVETIAFLGGFDEGHWGRLLRFFQLFQ